ncbi:MAG: DnaA/Hda family protein, partial [Candidatus Omnitrophota bacterium]
MIKGYKLVYSPTSDKRFRYKVKLSADEASCLGVIKEIGPICGRPFKNIGSDFEKAFYVYGSSDEVKSQIISALETRAADAPKPGKPSPVPEKFQPEHLHGAVTAKAAPLPEAAEASVSEDAAILSPAQDIPPPPEKEIAPKSEALHSSGPMPSGATPDSQARPRRTSQGSAAPETGVPAASQATPTPKAEGVSVSEFMQTPVPKVSPDVTKAVIGAQYEEGAFDIPPLNGKYRFDNLYEGGFNRFLKQACEDIAKEFSPSYNPLFIWGGVGRGKTHLIQALGNFIKRHHESKKVFYIQAQDLITMIHEALVSPAKKILLLKKLGSADALLIDDIQFLEGDEIQSVFFLIFERAYQQDHQIVFTSDRSPKQLAGFADRLRSRFEWGLVNKLQKPDFNSRREILKMKISTEFTSLKLTEEMLDYIADKFKDNIRELEGVLKKLNIYHKLQGEEVTMESLKNIVAELLGEETPEVVSSAPAPAAKDAVPGLAAPKTADLKAAPPAGNPVPGAPAAGQSKDSAPTAKDDKLPPPADFPPPPPEAQCPNCGSELSHIEMYDRWYCYSCGRYAPPDFGKGKHGVSSMAHKKDKKVDMEKLAALEELRKLASPQNTEPIPVIEEKDYESAEAAPVSKSQEPAAPETKESSAAPIKFTREIQCALFYPVRGDNAIKTVTEYMGTTVTKHRLHIKFDFIVQQEYKIPQINFSSFLNVLHTAKVKVAIVVGPPGNSGVNEDEFYEKLNGMFADEGLCFEYIAYKDIKQSYEYLNIVLDIANFGKQRLGYKMIKEEFHGGDSKKR